MNHAPIRADTEAKKAAVMRRLLTLWLDNPELRLSQLIINASKQPSDLYYVEDFPLLERLEQLYERTGS
jgi:hypothetical protein